MNEEPQELHLFASAWSEWHRSRRLFAPPIPQNILARMRPQPVREVPDAMLSADMSYFNLAVLAQPESKAKEAFFLFYLHGVRPVKLVAKEMEISPSYFYRIVKDFRSEAYRSYIAMVNGSVVKCEPHR